MTEQLKPCPLCGGTAELKGGNETPTDGACWWVQCSDIACFCSIGCHYMSDDGTAAIEAWNRRAQPAQAGQVLTDAEIGDLLDAARVPELPHGYEDVDLRIARAVEAAVRAKMGVAVPMTDPQLQTSEERRATGERIMALATSELSDLVRRARAIVVGHQRGSISLVQRHLQISYNTAAKLLEALEQEGVVSPQRQNGQREVLVLPNISGIVGKEGGNV